MNVVVFWIEPPNPAAFFPSMQQPMAYHTNDLGVALQVAEEKRRAGMRHVTISTENPDSVGQPGVTAVTDGKTPDGNEYGWKKRRL